MQVHPRQGADQGLLLVGQGRVKNVDFALGVFQQPLRPAAAGWSHTDTSEREQHEKLRIFLSSDSLMQPALPSPSPHLLSRFGQRGFKAVTLSPLFHYSFLPSFPRCQRSIIPDWVKDGDWGKIFRLFDPHLLIPLNEFVHPKPVIFRQSSL